MALPKLFPLPRVASKMPCMEAEGSSVIVLGTGVPDTVHHSGHL